MFSFFITKLFLCSFVHLSMKISKHFVKNQKIKKSFFFLKPSNLFKNDNLEGWKTFPYRLTITCRKGHFQASGDSKIQSSSVLHCPAFFPFFQNCPALSYILGYKCPAKSQKMSCNVLHCQNILYKPWKSM